LWSCDVASYESETCFRYQIPGKGERVTVYYYLSDLIVQYLESHIREMQFSMAVGANDDQVVRTVRAGNKGMQFVDVVDLRVKQPVGLCEPVHTADLATMLPDPLQMIGDGCVPLDDCGDNAPAIWDCISIPMVKSSNRGEQASIRRLRRATFTICISPDVLW
jgi:hypothetical protein